MAGNDAAEFAPGRVQVSVREEERKKTANNREWQEQRETYSDRMLRPESKVYGKETLIYKPHTEK